MGAKLLLRIASGVMFFHLLGHTYGHHTWKKTTDPVKQEVINQMTGHQFPFMGSVRSLADYFDGYGIACSIALLFFAMVLWLIAGGLRDNRWLSIKILGATTYCLFSWSICEFIYFFPFAACTTLLAAILSLAAYIIIRRQKEA